MCQSEGYGGKMPSEFIPMGRFGLMDFSAHRHGIGHIASIILEANRCLHLKILLAFKNGMIV